MIVGLVGWLGSRFRLLRSERGAGLVEYGLLVALIAVVCLTAVAFLGTATNGGINSAGSSMFPNP